MWISLFVFLSVALFTVLLNAEENIGFGTISLDQAKQLNNPVKHTQSSLNKGKLYFIQQCAGCHDRDGKGRSAVMGNAADLSRPSTWSQGDSDGEIFRTLHDGAGNNMPPFKYTITEDRDLWHLVNYVHSLRTNARKVEEEE